MYELFWSKKAMKDAVKIEQNGFKSQVAEIIATVERNPYEQTRHVEKLEGNWKPPRYSRRINIQHRFVYDILPNTEGRKDIYGEPYEGIIRIVSMWAHYEQ